MDSYKSKVLETVNFFKKSTTYRPKIAIILGSGLGSFVENIKDADSFLFEQIPNFQKTTVAGHGGSVLFGKIKDKEVLVQSGRNHFYEGFEMNLLVFPVRVYAMLGVEKIILTNAAGGINASFNVGDLMNISDHINLIGTNPLIGSESLNFGVRFPDMSEVYSKNLRDKAFEIASRKNINLKSGVYTAMSGPSYETPAEIKMLSILGADAVGMSTVHEAIASVHCGMKVLAFSCITNKAAGLGDKPLSHEEVKEAADKAKTYFKDLIVSIIEEI